jgi:transposase
MNAVGIDVSKGWSTVTVRQPLGAVIAKPYKVLHTVIELKNLAGFLKSLNGETRIVMENTGVYYQCIAKYLHEAGLFVSVVNAKCIRDFDNDSLRKVKTDKADARKIARYGIAHWEELREYIPEGTIRQQLKDYSRQYVFYSKTETRMKNNLLALLELTFPEIRPLFSDYVRDDGHEKWIDFAGKFWHMECVSSQSKAKFSEQYRKWCAKNGYRFTKSAVDDIYELSTKYIAVLPKDELTKTLIQQTVSQLNSTAETKAAILRKLKEIAQSMPEWEVVIEMCGVGEILASQLIAEIGDISRFERKQSLTGFAGVDSPPNQSGKVDQQGKPVTKSGSSYLRRALFLVISSLLMHQPNDKVYHFVDKKRSEGKHYLVYTVAGYNKFLKVYYGKVKEHISKRETIVT